MKKGGDYIKRFIALLVAILLIIMLILPNFVYADALTAAMIGSATYAIMQDAGAAFAVGSMTGQLSSDWISDKVGIYVGSHSIAEYFGSEIIRSVAGKLVVGATCYNAILGFIDWLQQNYDLSSQVVGVNGVYAAGGDPATVLDGWQPYIEAQNTGYWYNTWSNGTEYSSYNASVPVSQYDFDHVTVSYLGSFANAVFVYVRKNIGSTRSVTERLNYSVVYPDGYTVNTLTPDMTNYVRPTVLNPDKAWSGTIGGQAVPDTNLDQLMGEVFDGIADGDLTVDGEVIDVGPIPTFDPGPTPIPLPTYTPAPDILDGINTQIEQGNDIIGGINDLIGTADEAIDAVEGVTEAVEGVTDAVGDLTDTIVDSLDIPTSTEITEYKFDLRTLFPFCIPFDIARILQAFDGAAVAPHIQIPIVIQSINFSYTMDLDFSSFNSVAAILRQVELIAFAVVLAFATGKVIRW